MKLVYLLTVQVRVYCSEESDWWAAKSVATGQAGVIPRNYVTFDNDDKETQMFENNIVHLLGAGRSAPWSIRPTWVDPPHVMSRSAPRSVSFRPKKVQVVQPHRMGRSAPPRGSFRTPYEVVIYR